MCEWRKWGRASGTLKRTSQPKFRRGRSLRILAERSWSTAKTASTSLVSFSPNAVAVSLTFSFSLTHSLQLGGPFFQLNFRLAGVVCPDDEGSAPGGPVCDGVDVADIPFTVGACVCC